MRNAAGRAVLEQALEHADELEPELVRRLKVDLVSGGGGDLSALPRLLAVIDPLREEIARGLVNDSITLSSLAMVAAVTGVPAAECCGWAARALGDERLLTGWIDRGYASATAALAWSDSLEQAAAAADAGVAEAQRRGSAPMFLQLSWLRCDIAWRAGELDIAEDHAERAIDVGRELGADAEIVGTAVAPVASVENCTTRPVR